MMLELSEVISIVVTVTAIGSSALTSWEATIDSWLRNHSEAWLWYSETWLSHSETGLWHAVSVWSLCWECWVVRWISEVHCNE